MNFAFIVCPNSAMPITMCVYVSMVSNRRSNKIMICCLALRIWWNEWHLKHFIPSIKISLNLALFADATDNSTSISCFFYNQLLHNEQNILYAKRKKKSFLENYSSTTIFLTENTSIYCREQKSSSSYAFSIKVSFRWTFLQSVTNTWVNFYLNQFQFTLIRRR